MMCTTTVTWQDTIDSLWVDKNPTRIGDIPAGLGTPDKYILVFKDDQPLLRVDAYPSSQESFAFHDALIWHDLLVVGWGDCAYCIDIDSRSVTKHKLDSYFGHLYASEPHLLVASAERLWRIDRDGSIQWASDVLGIDGVTVDNISDGIIFGDGEWDPPEGWRPFHIDLNSGRNAK